MFKVVLWNRCYVLLGLPDNTDIEGAIEKWEAIVGFLEGPNALMEFFSGGSETCTLCVEFNNDQGCDGRPIEEATGLSFCHGTPYDSWRDHHDLSAAQAMLKFLEGLL